MNEESLPAPSTHRLRLPLAVVGVLMVLWTSLRLVLLRGLPEGPGSVPLAFAIGFVYDLAVASWVVLPLVLWEVIAASWIWRKPWHGRLLQAGWAVFAYLAVFLCATEWFFWDEFGARFNFIAVDYLVYTREVVGNIRESYPLPIILSALLVPAGLIVFATRGAVRRALESTTPMRARFRAAIPFLLAPLAAVLFVDASLAVHTGDRATAELAGNGPYSFVVAFLHNELDYDAYYRTLPDEEVAARLQAAVSRGGEAVEFPDNPLHHVVANPPAERQRNLLIVCVESLSATYMDTFRRPGREKGLTPRLDVLGEEGLLFTNLYATGLRTVRGLEAINLSLPPTPGRSIIKRPDNEGLETLGTVLRAHGRDTRFIYGGYGVFDNMNAWFGANGYDVVDRVDIPDDAIAYENTWGIADESLLDRVLLECDASADAGRPFFNFVMTTSNHRPFTYPEDRIDIPSGTSRDGAVKYTDWAIGRFVDEARLRPWFKDTILVIVADHCSGGRGATDLPLRFFRIPMIVIAPGLVEPGRFEDVCSQIDIAPTLLGMLGISYESRFFGSDVFRAPPGRALIGNYLHLGYFDGETLTTLGPRESVHAERMEGRKQVDAPVDEDAVERAVMWFQGAATAIDRGWQRLSK